MKIPFKVEIGTFTNYERGFYPENSQFQGQTFVVQNTDTEIIKNLLYEVLRRLTRIESGYPPVSQEKK